MVVRTCREYRAAKAAGYYAYTTFAMKMEGFVSAASAILEAATSAQVPTVSHLRSPRIGVSDLHLLTASILPIIGPDDEGKIAALGNMTLRELALSGKVSLVDVSGLRLNLVFNGTGMVLCELLRADLDADGTEEILVQYHTYAVGGTFGASSIGVLRRIGPDAPLSYQHWTPKSGLPTSPPAPN